MSGNAGDLIVARRGVARPFGVCSGMRVGLVLRWPGRVCKAGVSSCIDAESMWCGVGVVGFRLGEGRGVPLTDAL